MKLWMVIYITGQVAGSIGPLPYGEDECLRRSADRANQCTNSPKALPLTCEDIAFKCENSDTRPQTTFVAPNTKG